MKVYKQQNTAIFSDILAYRENVCDICCAVIIVIVSKIFACKWKIAFVILGRLIFAHYQKQFMIRTRNNIFKISTLEFQFWFFQWQKNVVP